MPEHQPLTPPEVPEPEPPRTTELEQAYIDLLYGFRTAPEIIRWAVRFVCSDNPVAQDRHLIEIASLDPKSKAELAQVAPKLTTTVRNRIGKLEMGSARIEKYVRAMFRKQCEAYNRRARTPYQLRQYVDLIKEDFDNPGWLDEFERNLDGVGPDTKRYEVPYLTPYIEQYLRGPRRV